MIKIENISKIYTNGGVETTALENINFSVKKGEFVAIMGPSGSGKSTLMHILGALDTPTQGKYLLDNKDVGKLSEDQLSEIRNKEIGFVFQAYNLLPRTTALKNVMLPMYFAGISTDKSKQTAEKYLQMVGLGNRTHHMSNQLSGGQQQRVAIARALTMNPKILLADEPTGNLATAQSEEIMKIFTDLNKAGHTVVMITHEPTVAKFAKRIITLKDGKIIEDKLNGHKL